MVIIVLINSLYDEASDVIDTLKSDPEILVGEQSVLAHSQEGCSSRACLQYFK